MAGPRRALWAEAFAGALPAVGVAAAVGVEDGGLERDAEFRVCRGYIGVMEKKMETINGLYSDYRVYIGDP